jgi:hypothetical protein
VSEEYVHRIAFDVATSFDDAAVRVIVDGEPVIERLYNAGPAGPPEELLGPDQPLRATSSPRTVRLAAAECTEDCCGALYVTIQRIGDEVVWRDWTDSIKVERPLHGPDRFAAAQYDEELARAERDRGWEWPARRLARLVNERFRADATLLGRWDCQFAGASAPAPDPEHVHVSFQRVGYLLHFVAVVPVPSGDPDAQVDAIVRELSDEDPRQQRWLVGGSLESIERFGFASPRRPPR